MWANRTITHAADARRYGIEGLIGIHWRTFETSLSLKALARAACKSRRDNRWHLGCRPQDSPL